MRKNAQPQSERSKFKIERDILFLNHQVGKNEKKKREIPTLNEDMEQRGLIHCTDGNVNFTTYLESNLTLPPAI